MSFKSRINRFGRKVVDFLSGEVIISWGWDRHIGFIFTIFALVVASIAWSLMVETRLVVTQKNERTLQELEISYQQLTIDLIGMDKRTKIESMLKESGSTLKAPDDPPQRVKL